MSSGIPPVAMMSPGAESLDRMGILLSWMLNSWLQRWARWREQPLLSCRANRGQREGVTLSGRFRNSPFWCRRPRIELAALGVSFSAKQPETSPELVWANLHKHFFIFINVKNTGSDKEFFKQIMAAAGMSKRILFFLYQCNRLLKASLSDRAVSPIYHSLSWKAKLDSRRLENNVKSSQQEENKVETVPSGVMKGSPQSLHAFQKA